MAISFVHPGRLCTDGMWEENGVVFSLQTKRAMYLTKSPFQLNLTTEKNSVGICLKKLLSDPKMVIFLTWKIFVCILFLTLKYNMHIIHVCYFG